MKSLRPWLVSLAAVLCVGVAQAASMDKSSIVRDYTDTVAPAEQQAYLAGVKAYNQCLAQHGFKYKWTAVRHVTGNNYMYSYDSDPVSWADFDKMHQQSAACDAVWSSEVDPHLIGETSAFMKIMPEMSHMMGKGDIGTGLISVTFFSIKGGSVAHQAFVDNVKMIAQAAEKSHWAGMFSFSRVEGGGPGAPDYVLVWPSRNWADYGTEVTPAMWTMVANAYGKKKADAIRDALSSVITASSNHIDAYSAELTYTPAK